MDNMIQKGDVMSYANAGSAILSGAVVEFGADATGFIGVAVKDIAATTGVGPVACEGVFELAAETGVAWAQGDLLYYDGSVLTKTSTSNRLAGVAWATKASAAAVGWIKLKGR